MFMYRKGMRYSWDLYIPNEMRDISRSKVREPTDVILSESRKMIGGRYIYNCVISSCTPG